MNVVFFGPPGAGKGTIADMISSRTGLPHVSTGDLFREAIRRETELGKQVKDLIEAGSLVPDEITIAIVQDRLRQDDTQEGVLFDGFPRTVAQADALEGIVSIDAVVNLRVDRDVIIRRLSGRRVCASCGHVHHVDFLPPKEEGVCDRCGGELYQRADDTVDAIKHRLDVYRDQTAELEEYYRDRNVLIDIDGNPAPDVVCDEVRKALRL